MVFRTSHLILRTSYLVPRTSIILTLCLFAANISAQVHINDDIIVSGSIQSDILLQSSDDADEGAGQSDSHNMLMNTYIDLNLTSKYVEAGTRLEYMEHPLPGFDKDFKGWGVPHFYVKGKLGNTELTAGTFYEQFGSGFILRSYEERSLGIDNSILGGRIVTRPVKGVQLKALTGKQRHYWEWSHSWLTGADVELNLDEWIKGLHEHETYLSLGGSWLTKYENKDNGKIFVDESHHLNFPQYVNAFDVRATFAKGGFRLLAEYGGKTQDPCFDNGYIYRRGNVAMLSASYSQSGLSFLVQAKRSDNMSMRSERGATGLAMYINNMPPFTMEHTYDLPALYPYATNPNGEWAYQAEVGYSFKKNTPLGGRYGTTVKLNFSHVHAIDRTNRESLEGLNDLRGTDGYGSRFFRWGDETYYQDFNIQLEKRMSRDFKLNLMYMNQRYNMTAIEGEGGMVRSNIFVAEGNYRVSKKVTLRAEAQYLATKDDDGDWAFGLLELSLAPHWMFTVSDEWNCGETDEHYYQASVAFSTGSHRLQAGIGRVCEGFNCSGGVCRYVPEYKGVTLSYNYNF